MSSLFENRHALSQVRCEIADDCSCSLGLAYCIRLEQKPTKARLYARLALSTNTTNLIARALPSKRPSSASVSFKGA